MSMVKPRYAPSKEKATHRYPTSVYWGEGYFGDKMRYIVAENDDIALAFVCESRSDIAMTNMQRRDSSGKWEFCA